MNEELKTALDAIKQVQAKRAKNWINASTVKNQELDDLYLRQLSVLNDQILSIENGTYKLT